MKQHNYIVNIVIKLKREYSKDELVQALTNKLQETETELGIVKSERDEANHNLNELLKCSESVKIEAQKNEYTNNLRLKIKELISVNKKLKRNNEELIFKIWQQQQKQ